MNTKLQSENIGDKITENYNSFINDRPTVKELEKMEAAFVRSERMRMFWTCVGWGALLIVGFIALTIILA